jgi:hypothetical protein
MMVERRDIVSPGERDQRSVDIGNPANQLGVDTTLELPDRYASDDCGMYRVVKDALDAVLCVHGRGGVGKGVSKVHCEQVVGRAGLPVDHQIQERQSMGNGRHERARIGKVRSYDPPDPVTGDRKASRGVITVELDDILSVIQIRTGTRADTIANHRSVDRYLHRETVPRPQQHRGGNKQ